MSISLAATIHFFFLVTPRVIRSDDGTENVNIAAAQTFLRSDHNDDLAGIKSFMYGKSSANQVNE